MADPASYLCPLGPWQTQSHTCALPASSDTGRPSLIPVLPLTPQTVADPGPHTSASPSSSEPGRPRLIPVPQLPPVDTGRPSLIPCLTLLLGTWQTRPHTLPQQPPGTLTDPEPHTCALDALLVTDKPRTLDTSTPLLRH